MKMDNLIVIDTFSPKDAKIWICSLLILQAFKTKHFGLHHSKEGIAMTQRIRNLVSMTCLVLKNERKFL